MVSEPQSLIVSQAAADLLCSTNLVFLCAEQRFHGEASVVSVPLLRKSPDRPGVANGARRRAIQIWPRAVRGVHGVAQDRGRAGGRSNARLWNGRLRGRVDSRIPATPRNSAGPIWLARLRAQRLLSSSARRKKTGEKLAAEIDRSAPLPPHAHAGRARPPRSGGRPKPAPVRSRGQEVEGAVLATHPVSAFDPIRILHGNIATHPLIQTTCFSVATTSTRSDWFAITTSMSL